ncbi:hypothetical protein BGZ74_003547, partial [Mortierella antarctica]
MGRLECATLAVLILNNEPTIIEGGAVTRELGMLGLGVDSSRSFPLNSLASMGEPYLIRGSLFQELDKLVCNSLGNTERNLEELFTILTNRMVSILQAHNILRGPNFKVLPGTMTKTPILILDSVMEDAREFNNEAWILFQDMRRCFDSVSCGPDGMLDRSLRHFRVHPRYIELLQYIAEVKTNKVITAFGCTDFYHPRCGLDQGGVQCPLLWRLSDEVLLCAVMDSGPMMKTSALYAHHDLPLPAVDTPDPAALMVSCLAFVDDTTWTASSRENLQGTNNIATTFFQLNAIEINPAKLKLTVVTPTSNVDEHSVSLAGSVASALPLATAARMLGVGFSADGSSNSTQALVHDEVTSICSMLTRKSVTDVQAIYIVNNVLILIILYQLTCTVLSAHELKLMVGKYTSTIRQKVAIPASLPNSILFHHHLYGLHALTDVQDEEQVSTALLHLNDTGLTGQVMAAQCDALHIHAHFPVHPLSVPSVASTVLKHNFVSHISHLMHNHAIAFKTPDMFQSTNVLITTVLEPHIYAQLVVQLHSDGVINLHQVITEDGLLLDSWTNMKTRHNLQGVRCKWHKALQKQLCIDDTQSDREDNIMGPGGAERESDDQLDGPSGPSDYDGDIGEIE